MHTLPKKTLSLAMALAALAGCIDAIGFIQLSGFFVSFMSGNSTRLAVSLQGGDLSAVYMPFSIICCFVIGTIAGALIRGHALVNNKIFGVLTAVTFLLLAGALCNDAGFGLASMLLIVLAMGVENSALQADNKNVLGVTYMTGTLVKMGQHIAAALQGGEKYLWLPYLLLWLGLITGGIAGAFAFFHFGAHALWIPALWSCLLAGLSYRLK